MTESRWYVLHAYSGYEKKVADSILDQANKLGISEQIEEVSVWCRSHRALILLSSFHCLNHSIVGFFY